MDIEVLTLVAIGLSVLGSFAIGQVLGYERGRRSGWRQAMKQENPPQVGKPMQRVMR